MIFEHVRILAVIVPQLPFREEQQHILLTDVIEVSITPCVSNTQNDSILFRMGRYYAPTRL